MPASLSGPQVVTETSIPNFLLKLWKLVDDEKFSHCIQWDENGVSFHILEPYIFSREILPLYFKHSNLNSFIRQLNMYGFRKVTNLEKGAMKPPPDQIDSLEFQHPYFIRNHPELLEYIKRKIPNPRAHVQQQQPQNVATQHTFVLRDVDGEKTFTINADSDLAQNLAHLTQQTNANNTVNLSEINIHNPAPSDDVITENQPIGEQEAGSGLTGGSGPTNSQKTTAQLLQEVQQMRNKQIEMDQKLSRVQLENRTLWREIAHLRRTHLKQQEVVNKLIRFLLLFAGQRARNQRGPVETGLTAKRRILAIGSSDQQQVPQNEPRGDNNTSSFGPQGSNNWGPGPAAYTAEDAARIMASLEQELLKSASKAPLSTPHGSPNSTSRDSPDTTNEGLTISDVTHEMDEVDKAEAMKEVENEQLADQLFYVSPASNDPSIVTSPGPSFFGNGPSGNGPRASFSAPFVEPDLNFGNDPALSVAIPSTSTGPIQPPEFSNHLDFMQTDLDSIRDFLSSDDFNLNQSDLSNIFDVTLNQDDFNVANRQFTTTPDSNNLNLNLNLDQNIYGKDIVGNEVQLYKPPELLTPSLLSNQSQGQPHQAAGGKGQSGQSRGFVGQSHDPMVSSSSCVPGSSNFGFQTESPSMTNDVFDMNTLLTNAMMTTPTVTTPTLETPIVSPMPRNDSAVTWSNPVNVITTAAPPTASNFRSISLKRELPQSDQSGGQPAAKILVKTAPTTAYVTLAPKPSGSSPSGQKRIIVIQKKGSKK